MDSEKRILLVDDEPLIRRSLQKSVERAGYSVEVAEDTRSGLRAFSEAHENAGGFDLAVIDLNMPDFEGKPHHTAGLDLVSRILEQQPDLPIIVLTAYDEVGKAKDALSHGAKNFFVKGRDTSLITAIDELIS
jgi:CheY-like chemotaxis protein